MGASATEVMPYIDPRKAALLVIDMQEGFCNANALMETSGVGTSNQRGIIPDVVKLVGLVREHGIPVFWSQQVHFPEDVTRKRRLDTIPGHMDKQNFAPCLRGTWEVDFVPEMDVRDEDYVIEKHRASMFQETTLPAKLRMLGIEQVIVCGVTTEFCCETTIRDAYYRDLDVVVVRECVAGPYPEYGEDTLKKVATFWGAVVSLDELRGLIKSDRVPA